MRLNVARLSFPAMLFSLATLFIPAMLSGGITVVAGGESHSRRIEFNRDIRPLLADRCLACHGADAAHREAGLRLDDPAITQPDSEGRHIIVPGKFAAGLLIERVTSADPDVRMPPPKSEKSLSPDEIQLLKQWIDEGAVFEAHWAYVVPRKTSEPESESAANWQRNWIDAYIAARHASEGLRPNPDADPVTLIRRLFTDLTGLPPGIEDVERLTADWNEATYEKLVDELLASEDSAERLAMYWLDLVRYADTVGYHGDQDHNISPYRDWVIDSLHQNMPFDQFTREQLAGDLLPEATIDQKIASGYNRMLQTTHEGGLQPKEYLTIYAADRVRNVSAVWMGATVGCAQCHDHKFDPYTARDFYALSAFFADIDEEQHFKTGSNALPTQRPPELKVHTRRERHELARLRQQLAAAKAASEAAPDDPALAERVKQLGFAVEDLEVSARLTMVSVALPQPRVTRVLNRGDWMDETGEIVAPAIPAFLGTVQSHGKRATRLDLANWLVDAESGNGRLTARVFANRFWYLMFGAGLTSSLADFGGQGNAPDHPELLDRLAIEFVDSGWNVRHMLKLIVMSRTYRQSSVESAELRNRDPANRLFTRQSSFRLPAETIRDNALAVSGLLVRKFGGGSVRPYQPDDYYRHLNFPTRTYHHHTDSRQWQRGVYIHWQRQFLHPTLRAFDAPSREECTAQRPVSNTPLAALASLNDPTFAEAARQFAARILNDSGSNRTGQQDEARLDLAFRMALSRTPDDAELTMLSALLQNARREFADAPESAAKLIQVGQSPPAALDVTEHAAWTTVARAILNLDECLTRY